ncbi:hypothetical protein AGMMS49579_16260 [Spirochaetia bacterium]|nr:hypothetical protein AGMMS49579_16260 [Spirochaetia bacterium]
MKGPILVVLAAGLGSRYGGLKQMDKIGNNGEALLDYSVYDAVRSGFKKVVFIIRHYFEEDFKNLILKRIGSSVDCELAFQELDTKVPAVIFEAAERAGRTKPWGTAHALLCVKEKIDAPFAILNADDFYGLEAFNAMGAFLKNDGAAEGAIVPYQLEKTLSPQGTVTRGVCKIKDDYLVSVDELKSIVTQMSSGWLTSHTPAINIEGLRQELFFGESKDNPYKLSRYFIEGDEFINFARNQKKWNDAGFWREDVLNNQSDTREKMFAGLTGADQHHSQTWYGSVRPTMTKNFPGSEAGIFWFGEEQNNLVSLNITHGAMAVAAKSKNPERALMVYDLIRNDEEIYRLFNYGIEGQHYTAEGRSIIRDPDFNNAVQGITTNFWWGRNDDLELRNSLVDWPVTEALFAVYDKVSIPYPYGQVIFNLDPISSQLDNLSNVYNTYMPRIVFGKFTNVEQYIGEFRTALKNAGYEQVLANVEAQLAAVYKK